MLSFENQKRHYTITQRHGYHLVDPSPWPLFTAFGAFFIVFGFVLFFHNFGASTLLKNGFFLTIASLFGWWRDVVRESTFQGRHTSKVGRGLRVGMILFIVSEVMFFFAFFWAFFHSSFNPSIFIGGVWPPAHLVVMNPWKIPLLNTVILLASGASITWTHHLLIAGNRNEALKGLSVTILFALVFLYLQKYEYANAPFCISDTVYGSTFYMATGFHGFHVFVGTCFLIVCLGRLYCNHFTSARHFGFEAAAWYWHFVDVVWLFLFITIYWWGS